MEKSLKWSGMLSAAKASSQKWANGCGCVQANWCQRKDVDSALNTSSKPVLDSNRSYALTNMMKYEPQLGGYCKIFQDELANDRNKELTGELIQVIDQSLNSHGL